MNKKTKRITCANCGASLDNSNHKVYDGCKGVLKKCIVCNECYEVLKEREEFVVLQQKVSDLDRLLTKYDLLIGERLDRLQIDINSKLFTYIFIFLSAVLFQILLIKIFTVIL